MSLFIPFGYIYITTNLVNGKKYIGQSSKILKLQSYLGSGKNLKKAVKKYGRENFSKEIIYWAFDLEELNRSEEFIIIECNAIHSHDYYNLKSGGMGHELSDETRKKLSEATTRFFTCEHNKVLWKEYGKIGANSKNHKDAITSKDYKSNMSFIIKNKFKNEDFYNSYLQKRNSIEFKIKHKEAMNTSETKLKLQNQPNRKRILYNNIEYESQKQFRIKTKISRNKMNRLKRDKLIIEI